MDEGTVLIVDDNPNNVALLGDVLRAGGHRVRGAADGPQALKIAAARSPDLVLLDLQMPGMDGYEVCRRLKQDAATRDIPVIVISALDDVADKVKAFETGAVDYVSKPFQAPEVLARVATHLELFRLQRDLRRREAELAARNAELQRTNEDLVRAQRRTERVFSALSAALPGTVLDERYRLEARVGDGAFGTVFRAEHLALERPVAVKVFRPWEGVEGPLALERFRQEGVSACRVNHPNAVTILDCGISESGIAYLVMEFLEGVTLYELIKSGRSLPAARCLEIARPICEVLAAAHAQGVVHRDVKPENVFLHHGPQGEVVKVLDFGIAKLVSATETEESRPLTRGFVGTPVYTAPERLLDRPYDGRADVYSVGVMLYRMLSGSFPLPFSRGENMLATAIRNAEHDPEPLSDAMSSVAPDLERLVMDALARDPSERPTADEMTRRLAVLP